ncbi:zinc D-Ala-D-Ala carboxypeptidase [Nocardioides albertanoniae]|uniref:Zinc D-Ala-D-Ala carboxypeptidase n=1 Tax=Nocardioides albertanoniae TaxID=1175486 RepID=A0A543A1Y7_9ACTN|nr:D-Ala-D-Ala carboxypeptidase family metallohydrolase [Nocardioides albertanoniae]TQL66611.1 zinc D-Ala-D-Ala carboxypeptidase [Nocardioides albertanoniae]
MRLTPRPGRRLGTVIGTLLVTLATSLVAITSTAAPAQADACYTWDGTLRQGSTGAGVTQLQIRVAGWAASGTVFTIDGSYGPATTTAVRNFQAAYGLGADGVAGPNTFSKIYALQDDDCTPVHFAWNEVDDVCYGGWPAPISGTVAQVKANLMQAMWRAEAIRHRLGDHPLRVTSAYRSKACNDQVGGATNSNHLYGRAMDLVPGDGATSLCSIGRASRQSFPQVLGPGYPGHNDHIHAGIQSSVYHNAPSCF